MFSYYHEEDESSFQLVDTSRPQRPIYQRNRNKFGQVRRTCEIQMYNVRRVQKKNTGSGVQCIPSCYLFKRYIIIVKLMLGIKKIKSASHFDNILKHMQYSKYGPKG